MAEVWQHQPSRGWSHLHREHFFLDASTAIGLMLSQPTPPHPPPPPLPHPKSQHMHPSLSAQPCWRSCFSRSLGHGRNLAALV